MEPLESHEEHLNEKTFSKYVTIKIKSFKDELEMIEHRFRSGDLRRAEESLSDLIESLKDLKRRL